MIVLQVVLIEIETGFDSALFPEILEFDIEGAVCDYYTRCVTQEIARKKEQVRLDKRQLNHQNPTKLVDSAEVVER